MKPTAAKPSPKSHSGKPPNKEAQELTSMAFFGDAPLPPDIRPGELAAIAACLCSSKGKGKVADYFEEAMQAVGDAAQFLAEIKRELRNAKVKRGPHGHLKTATGVPTQVIIRPLPAGGLTFSKLLAPTGEVDKHGNRTNWFVTITTEKYLREFIRKAGRNQVLTPSEVGEILERKTIGPAQYIKLLAFQKGCYLNRGKAVAVSREENALRKKVLGKRTRRTLGAR